MEIQEIKTRLDILAVLKHYNLQPDRNKRINCPFHNDKTPSMQVYPETNTVFCFSSNCQLNGKAIDQIDFIMHKESCTKHEALNKAKGLLNHVPTTKPINHTPVKPEPIPALSEVEGNTEILSKIFNYFRNGFIILLISRQKSADGWSRASLAARPCNRGIVANARSNIRFTVKA